MALLLPTTALLQALSIFAVLHFTQARLGLSSSLRTIGSKALSMDFSKVDLLETGTKPFTYTIGAGVIYYRSSVISALSQLDRGEKEAAMESFRVAIASLTLDTTQTFGLPIVSVIIDKMVKKYGSSFPKTIAGFKSYNQMLGDSILKQANTVASPGMLDNANEVLDTLDTLKNRIKTNFANEVDSFVKSSQAYDDMVKSLKNAKTWAKVAKWGDFLTGPVFDTANIAFSGWQLHEAIKSGNDLSIASNSLSIAGSIVGVGAFVVGSLATAGSIVAAVAGPVGALVGCVLSLAALIIDVINEYNPEQTIKEHLNLVRSLTKASKEQMEGAHSDMLLRVNGNGIQAGFGTLFDVNQAMLVEAKIEDQWDIIKGMRGNDAQLVFKPELVKGQDGYLVVGDVRVFDKAMYSNWAFKPSGKIEVGYNYYGKKLKYNEDGVFVRLNTEMVTNKEDKMWFWLNGADITTYAKGDENVAVDDNVNIGDFRTFLRTSDRYLVVNTGGGNDLVQLTGVVCSAEHLTRVDNKCLLLRMGDGFDTLSFEGMDMREEKRKWFLKNDDLSKYHLVVGVVVDAKHGVVHYRVRSDNGAISDVKFCGMASVEGFVGSPMDDIVKLDDQERYHVKQTVGKNVYEISYKYKGRCRQHTIEDNSDKPGKLILYKEGLVWGNVIFDKNTNILVVHLGRKDYAQILLKRCKPGLEDFEVKVGKLETKRIKDLPNVGENSDMLLPYVPYSYYYDRNLIATADVRTFVELCLPKGSYPDKAVNYHIRFVFLYSRLILSQEILKALRENRYSLIAKRNGKRDTEGSWTLELTKPHQSGGWHIDVGHIGNFVIGAPGSFQNLFELRHRNENRLDIFKEYQTIKEERVFNSTNNYYGDDEPEKLLFKYPTNFSKISPPAAHVIDLKGPKKPLMDGKNELVLDEWLAKSIATHGLDRYVKMELERATVQDDWHLKMYSNWNYRVLRADVTLRNVHTIICDKLLLWQFILNLYDSKETEYDLNQIIKERLGTQR